MKSAVLNLKIWYIKSGTRMTLKYEIFKKVAVQWAYYSNFATLFDMWYYNLCKKIDTYDEEDLQDSFWWSIWIYFNKQNQGFGFFHIGLVHDLKYFFLKSCNCMFEDFRKWYRLTVLWKTSYVWMWILHCSLLFNS